jgi:HAD superfamily hydrolase (TIGR01549 family)
MRVRAVLFDLFDTLVDLRFDTLPEIEIAGRRYRATYGHLHQTIVQRFPIDFEPFARALVEVDRDLRDEFYAKGRELPTQQRFRALLEHLGLEDDDLADRLTDVHMDLLRGQAVYLDHHPALVEQLGERVRLGVVSNFSHSPTALGILEQAGLRQHLDAIVISDSGGIRKPRPEIFEEALGLLGVSAHETVHVGDSLDADVRGAGELGMRTGWLTRRVRDPERALREHGGPGPDWTLGDLAELPGLLQADG